MEAPAIDDARPADFKLRPLKLFNKPGKVVIILLLIGCLATNGAHSRQTISTTTTTTSNAKNASENASAPVSASETTSENTTTLLSSEEFADQDPEAPTLLFDNTEENSRAQDSELGQSVPTTTVPNGTTSGDTTAKASLSNNQIDRPTSGNENSTAISDDEESSTQDNESSALTYSGATNFEAPQNVSQYMDYIEKLFHDLRHQISDLFEPHLPQLIRTSQSVELSGGCSFDMLRMAIALRQFEPWALQMIDSSGKLPEGIFEGSFTALGSYDQCLSVVFGNKFASAATKQDESEQDGSDLKQQTATRGKYCLVTVSPFMPPKPPLEKIERMFQEEADRRNYTEDNQFSRLSPMFYYMKFRIGVCIPSSCQQSDMESISRALSTNLRLNITIPNCSVKQPDEPFTMHQLVAGTIFATVLALVVGSTLYDCFKQKCEELRRREIQLLAHSDERRESNNNDMIIKIGITSRHEDNGYMDAININYNFFKRLQAHWLWMSFSLLTSFRLYFGREKLFTRRHAEPSNGQKVNTDEKEPIIIKCLDGIRVISLCWVIIANSYLTLDPRATKRLTKTREAPKDFMFQIVAQASLAIETFFFLSGLLMSLSFSRKFKSQPVDDDGESQNKKTKWLQWVQFYIHRYVRMTPATMLIIALSMYLYHFGDGPIWFEATKKAHDSCKQNWWRHMLHVANFIDTRQMCFIHYWYISADMQLFMLAPILLNLVIKYKYLGYTLIGLIGSGSIFSIFYTTYVRNLPPTLLFYSSDPESRREFGNIIMTKPLTHVLPYLVGMFVGQWLAFQTTLAAAPIADTSLNSSASDNLCQQKQKTPQAAWNYFDNNSYAATTTTVAYGGGGDQRKRCISKSVSKLFALFALLVALAEVFLPYKWNNSHLPTRLMASIYASLFRLAWSLVLAYLVISCAHKRNSRCQKTDKRKGICCRACKCSSNSIGGDNQVAVGLNEQQQDQQVQPAAAVALERQKWCHSYCFCSSGGNLVNQLLSLSIFTHLSKLSFVAYLIHLPLMSLFVQQTRGLFAFSHTLVIHLALSYLVMTFLLAFALVHIIEFPFITFECQLFHRLYNIAVGPKLQQQTKEEAQKEPVYVRREASA